tara:strand:- start:1917 stop:3119 length:1203 start_codon:yes stop_codon:yes gene_type:complete
MAEETGFSTMGRVLGDGSSAPNIGIGMLGYAFMGKAHSNAYKTIPYMMYPPPAHPVLERIAGRNEEGVRAAADRFGFRNYATDWRDVVNDPNVQILDNGGPNSIHLEPTLAAIELGKHVVCEKPLGRNPAESRRMWQAAENAGVKHMTAFNYRFVPAIVLARKLINDGAIGEIRHFRGQYSQEWLVDSNTPRLWRMDKESAGSGALGDLGAHTIDLARFLVGEPVAVNGRMSTFVSERPNPDDASKMEPVTVDDAYAALVEFDTGIIGTIEATRYANGRKNGNAFEINGSKGSLAFNIENLNELQVYILDSEPREANGFRSVSVTEQYHPYWDNWWPQGHIIGWEHTFVHELYHFLDCVTNDKPVGPWGATFEDGYKADVVAAAIAASAENNGARVEVKY